MAFRLVTQTTKEFSRQIISSADSVASLFTRAKATQTPSTAARQFQPMTKPVQQSLLHTSAPTQQNISYGTFLDGVISGHRRIYGKPEVHGLQHLTSTIKTRQPTMIVAAPHKYDPSDTIRIAQASNLTVEHHIPLPTETVAGMKIAVEATLEFFAQLSFEEYAALLDQNRTRKNMTQDPVVAAQKAQTIRDATQTELDFIKKSLSGINALCDEWIVAAAQDRLPSYVDTSQQDPSHTKSLTVVAREEMKNHPLLGPLLNAVKAVFTSRSTEGAAGQMKAELEQRLRNVVPIIFPESARGSSASNEVYGIRPGASLLARDLDISQVVAAVHYHSPNHHDTRVTFLPPLPKIGTAPERLPPLFVNQLVQRVVAEIIGYTASSHYLHGDGKPRAPTGLPPAPKK